MYFLFVCVRIKWAANHFATETEIIHILMKTNTSLVSLDLSGNDCQKFHSLCCNPDFWIITDNKIGDKMVRLIFDLLSSNNTLTQLNLSGDKK